MINSVNNLGLVVVSPIRHLLFFGISLFIVVIGALILSIKVYIGGTILIVTLFYSYRYLKGIINIHEVVKKIRH